MRSHRTLALILLLAFAVRLGAAALAPHPGISDSNHYYNLARNLADGRGFVIDYIWQYHNPPADVTHPVDYWMPLPALPPALMLALFPDNLLAALLPSVLIGTGIVALAYAVALAAGWSRETALLSALLAAFLPELVLNSARTDTTLLYVLWVGLAALAFDAGMRRRRRFPLWLLLTGVCAGLAHLSRQDAIILAPALLLAIGVYARFSPDRVPWRFLPLIPAGWLLVLAPWMLRNLAVLGVPLPSGASRTLFMTSFIDQFTYGRTLDLQHYLDWGLPNIIANIATQTAANVAMLYTLLDVLLPVLVVVGLGLLLTRRAGASLRLLALPALTILGLFAFYSFLTPFHTQGGSFKKSAMLMLPFAAAVGAWALTQIVTARRLRIAVAVTGAAFMLLNALLLVRNDFLLANRFNQSVIGLVADLQAAGDVTGDGEIIVMTQDPFILSYHGIRALMIPSDPRDMILEAAYRYHVDYIVMPAARPALDPLYDGRTSDPRLDLIFIDSPDFRLLRVEGGNQR